MSGDADCPPLGQRFCVMVLPIGVARAQRYARADPSPGGVAHDSAVFFRLEVPEVWPRLHDRDLQPWRATPVTRTRPGHRRLLRGMQCALAHRAGSARPDRRSRDSRVFQPTEHAYAPPDRPDPLATRAGIPVAAQALTLINPGHRVA